MNRLFKLNELRSLSHYSQSAGGLRTITTCSSLIGKHSIVSSSHSSLVPSHSVRNFRSSSRSKYEIAPPINWGIRIVPEKRAFVIHRFGKYHRTLDSGIHFLIPIVDKIAFVHSLKEVVVDMPNQSVFTKDNVRIEIEGAIYLKVEDYKRASYGSEHPFDASITLAQDITRSVIANLSLDKTLSERENLNDRIVRELNDSCKQEYGLKCIRCVIKKITPPEKVKESMELQADAERKKRVKILDSEGEKEAAINKAEGEREAAFLAAEGELARADATSKGLALVSQSLKEIGGLEAASLKVAEQYVDAFGNRIRILS
ncbi:hypothetical protein M0R45_038382 [Rubus argutus]|uniref:Band 7 domain-containing protein n=1 Tax=Rubus argutus TaxID=59490 RepID=A0AAW1W540_RUBAR